jgi:hypothetical protein
MEQAQSVCATLPLEQVTQDIALIILAIVKNLQAQPQEPLSWYYRYTLSHMIRNLERFVTPRVSVDAQRKADEWVLVIFLNSNGEINLSE